MSDNEFESWWLDYAESPWGEDIDYIETAEAAWDAATQQCSQQIATLQSQLEELQGKVEQQDDVLHHIHSWCQAYPLDIFPEPTKEDWAAARDALKNTDVPLDRVSASNMRHVVTQISEMIEQALQAEGEKDEQS